MTDKRLSEKEVAHRWGVTTRSLQNWRKLGKGPAFLVIGQNTILYREEDIAAYEEQHLQGGYVPQQCKKAMRRAAEALSLVTTWPSTKPQAREKLGEISDELRDLIGEEA